MSQKTFNIRYISIFIDRLIPDYFKKQYPKYKLFIYHYLKYLEQNNKAWDNIYNYIKFIDIDKIDAETDLEKKEILLNEMYKQFLGTEETRYLSSLMDDVIFIKNQKTILKQKGTKSSFLFFLNLALGGYFNIENLDGAGKVHDGTFTYNGVYTYNNGDDYLEPFVYKVISEFTPSQYNTIINFLNPAGMTPIYFFQKQIEIDSETGDTLENIYNYPNIYIEFYNSETPSTPLGIVKSNSILSLQQISIDSSSYDLLLQNGNKYNEISESSPSATNIFYNSIVNTSFFSGTYDSIKVLSNPVINGLPASEYSYDFSSDTLTNEGILLYDSFIDGGEEFSILNTTNIQVMINF